MSDYKDTHELYQSVFDEVHAPDELVKKIKSMDTTKHKKTNRIKYISAIAACLAAVMLVTLVVVNFKGGGNSFVLKASAAEIGGNSFVKVASVAPISGESSVMVDGDKKTRVYNCAVPFAIFCDGRNIKSIKYTVDNAVYLFPYDSFASEYREQYPDKAAASDKITDKVESDNKIESYIEKDKQYSSYSVDFENQYTTEFKDYSEMQTFPVFLLAHISSDDNVSDEAKAAIKHLNSEGSVSDESYVNEIMNDFRVIYDEMFSKVRVTAEVTFEDGTTDSTSLQFGCISVDMQNGPVIGAKAV